MTAIDRRNFLKSLGIGGAGIALAGSPLLISACSSVKKADSGTETELVALRVSSDLYKTDLKQRFAFSIFDQDSKVASEGKLDVEITSPTSKKQTFKDVEVREKGIPGQGIFSVMAVLDEVGNWEMKTKFKGKQLDLAFAVEQTNIAPALNKPCPTGPTPTEKNPLDATILCTRFDGDCGLHKTDVPSLLNSKKPFVVIFATPARCQTSYCGPVLDLTKEVAKNSDIKAIHIEIYKNETSNDVLDAVSEWGLQTEPWLFGINADGTINSRLDGAFDMSEIEEVFAQLS